MVTKPDVFDKEREILMRLGGLSFDEAQHEVQHSIDQALRRAEERRDNLQGRTRWAS